MTAAAWRRELEAALGAAARVERIAGGDINEAWRVELADGRRVFVKTHAAPPPGMYAAEADGLAWLAEGPLRVPAVVAVGERFLALEWLELADRGRGRFDERSEAMGGGDPAGSAGGAGGKAPRGMEERLGRALAGLHALGAPSHGLHRDNYLATLPQDNTSTGDAGAFWIERRLRPTIARLGDRALIARLERGLDRLASQPERFGAPERPARLHGDLWWGNVGACGDEPVVFDPAVYGGHREIDLAMLALFGGLGDALIGAYEEVWPLAAGWRERLRLWQLYPIAVHAVLFGGSYVHQLARGVDAL